MARNSFPHGRAARVISVSDPAARGQRCSSWTDVAYALWSAIGTRLIIAGVITLNLSGALNRNRGDRLKSTDAPRHWLR